MSVREALIRILSEHGPTGYVHSGEGWVECECSARIPCDLDKHGDALDWGAEVAARRQHEVDSLLEAGVTIL